MKFFFHVRKKDWAAAGIFSFVYCALQGGFVFVFDWFSPWLLHRFAQTFQPSSQTPPETAQKISQLHLFLLQKRQPYLRLTYYLMVIVIVSYILYLIAARPRPFVGLLVGGRSLCPVPPELDFAVSGPLRPWGSAGLVYRLAV